MLKKSFIFFLLILFFFSLNGCATARKQKDLEIQGLKNQISVLEARIESKDQDLETLKNTVTELEEENNAVKARLTSSQVAVREKTKKRPIGEIKSRPNIKQIQIALTNAGYDAGSIDGNLGKKTRSAIKAFQRDHNLPADGRVGKETWNLLKEYLYKKIK